MNHSARSNEFLNHRVRQQFTGKLSDPGQSAVIGLTTQFHLEPLALPHAHHIAVSKALGRRVRWLLPAGRESPA